MKKIMQKRKAVKFSPAHVFETLILGSPHYKKWSKRWVVPEVETLEWVNNALRSQLSKDLALVRYEIIILVNDPDPNKRIYAAVFSDGNYSPVAADGIELDDEELTPIVREYRQSNVRMIKEAEAWTKDRENWVNAFNITSLNKSEGV